MLQFIFQLSLLYLLFPLPSAILSSKSSKVQGIIWHTGEFSRCIVENSICGFGKQFRSVYCYNTLKKMRIQDFNCFLFVKQAVPLKEQKCWKPCWDEEVYSEWNPWSLCLLNLTSHIGFKLRFRKLVASKDSPLERKSNASSQFKTMAQAMCKINVSDRLAFIQLLYSLNDKNISNHLSPRWIKFSQSNCHFREVELGCGVGEVESQYKCFFQFNNFAFKTHSKNCRELELPKTHSSCEVICSGECLYSSWSEWSQCKKPCELNIRRRSRSVIRQTTAGMCTDEEQTQECVKSVNCF